MAVKCRGLYRQRRTLAIAAFGWVVAAPSHDLLAYVDQPIVLIPEMLLGQGETL